MADLAEIIARVRTELGDLAEDFVVPARGGQAVIELGTRNVIPESLTVTITEPGVAGALADPSRLLLKQRTGILTLLDVPTELAQVSIIGEHYPIYSDAEISRFVNDAAIQHMHEREITTRYRDDRGHIKYQRDPLTIATLPDFEIVPLAILATIEALWSMSTDAASDIDVVTAEGTHIPRGQRYDQIMRHITELTSRYKLLCQQYNIGIYRVAVGTMRRVSYMTGRLVPVFRPREYDDWDMPTRELPPIDSPNEDESGIPSPVWGGWGW